MKIAAIGLASMFALSSTCAFAHSNKHHHYMRSMARMRGSTATSNPNGTAAGPTRLSGTGSSKFGGRSHGSSRATYQ